MSSPFETCSITEAYRNRCQDRAKVIVQGDRSVLVVADGAGGTGDGEEAAETVIREIESHYQKINSSEGWKNLLSQIDLRIGAGESTAVIVDVRPDATFGASVGDSRAWLIRYENLLDLTSSQIRKPLLGSGAATPTQFEYGTLNGTLIVSTDGFCNYVKREELLKTIPHVPFQELPKRLVELVRLPSGDLWDDVGIVLCRQRPKESSRKRYEL